MQKAAAVPWPPQQPSPTAPQPPKPAELMQLPRGTVVPLAPSHVPTPPGQALAAATQLPPTQQPFVAQVASAQQGWPVPPQVVNVPARQTWVLSVPASPDGMQVPLVESRQAPAGQLLPEQGAWKAPPHTPQTLAVQA